MIKLPTVSYGALEIFLNRAIQANPVALQLAQKLQDKTLQVEVTDFHLTLVFVGTSHGLQVMPQAHAIADVCLTGSAQSFSRIIKDKKQGLASGGVRIEGDVGTAQSFTQLFSELDFDLGDWLDRHLGPVPAFFLERGIKGMQAFGQRLSDALITNTAEHFRDETGDIIGSREHDYMAGAIDRLAHEGQKLQQRLRKLDAANP